MNGRQRALLAGAAGALVTNVIHELTRHVDDGAPRVDLLGMQALARLIQGAGAEPPRGKALYGATLAGDLVANTLTNATLALAGRWTFPAGLALGLANGLGAVVLPPRLGLDPAPTAATAQRRILTVIDYLAGALATVAALELLPPASSAAKTSPDASMAASEVPDAPDPALSV